MFQPLETRIKQLDEEIPKIEAAVDLLRIDTLSTDHILAESKDLYERWPHLSYDEKRQVVESVTEKIVVGKGELAIELAYFPSSKDLTNEERTVLCWWQRWAQRAWLGKHSPGRPRLMVASG